VQSRRHEHVRELRELLKQLLAEVEHFFVSYNEIKGKKFNPLGRCGSAPALALVRKGCKQAAWLKKPW
jgi:inorganic pyrophosphatase